MPIFGNANFCCCFAQHIHRHQPPSMNLLRLLFISSLLFIFFLSVTTPFSACTKTITQIEHDTTVVTRTDTITQIDTLIVVDSIYDLQDGLVGYYNFNGGNLNDSSGYGNNITFNNATPTTDRFERANNAYFFDGVNNYMVIPNDGTLNPTNITIKAIVKFSGFNLGICHASQILMKGSQDQDQGTYGIRVIQGDGSCATELDTTTQQFSGYYGDYGYPAGCLDHNYYIRTNTWVTMVYTYDGRKSSIYINGELSSTTNGTAQFYPNGYDVYIGKTQNPTYPYTFNGAIDEIRIYNRAISPAAVKQLSNLTN